MSAGLRQGDLRDWVYRAPAAASPSIGLVRRLEKAKESPPHLAPVRHDINVAPASTVMILGVFEVDEKERVPIEEGDVFGLVLVGVVDRLLHQDLCVAVEGCRITIQACDAPMEIIWRAASLGELVEADDARSLVVEGGEPSRGAAR